jgi:hypothetical protein
VVRVPRCSQSPRPTTMADDGLATTPRSVENCSAADLGPPVLFEQPVFQSLSQFLQMARIA